MATREQIQTALVAAHNAGNTEDARMLATALKNMPVEKAQPPTTKSIMFDAIDANLRAQGLPSRGMAAGVARYGAAIPGSAGGPLGAAFNAGGEAVAQVIETGGIESPGTVTAAGITGSVPFAAAGAKLRTLQNIGRTVGGVVAGEEARSIIDDGQLSDPTQPAVIAGGLAAVAPVVGRVAGKVMGNVDPVEAAELAKAQTRNATRDASIKAGQDIGMAVPPTTVNDSWFNRKLEGFAGPARVARQAGVNNNIAGGEAIAADIGIGKGVDVTPSLLDKMETKAAEPYRRIEAMSSNGGFTMYGDFEANPGFLTSDHTAVATGAARSAKVNPKNPLVIEGDQLKVMADRNELDPDWKEKAFAKGHDAIFIDNGGGRIDAFIPPVFDKKSVIIKGTPIETAASDLAEMKQARSDAKGYRANNAPGSKTYDPKNTVLAMAAEAKEKALAERIRTAALQSGDSKLMADFIAARREIAKINAVAGALNPDNTTIDLRAFGSMSDKGVPLDGAMKTVGAFSNATEGKFTRPTASMPNPGSSGLDAPAQMAAWLAGGIKGLAISTANLARDPVRNAMLSKWGQKTLAQPNYVPRTVADQQVTNMTKRIAAIMALQMGSRVNPEKNPFMPQPVGQP